MNTPIAPDKAVSGHESKDCSLDALAAPGHASRGRRCGAQAMAEQWTNAISEKRIAA